MSCQHFPSMGSDPVETDPIETQMSQRNRHPSDASPLVEWRKELVAVTFIYS